MIRFKNLFIVMAALSAVLIFTSCQDEPTLVESGQTSLPKFSLPEGATFESATFYIFVEQASGQDVNVHRVTSPWEACTVTWNNFGGSFAPEAEGTFNASTDWTWHSTDVSSLVEGWLNGTYPNYGILLDQVNKTYPRTTYAVREKWEYAAYLEVCYTDAGGVLVCDTTKEIQDTFIYELNPDENRCIDWVLYTGWGYETDLEKQALIQFDLDFTPTPPEIKCETSYAYDEDGTCFNELGFGNWGWSIPLSEQGIYTFPVYAGAGQCDLTKGTYVGDVTVNYSGGTVQFSYSFLSGFSTEETHFYAGYDPVPRDKKGKPTVAPGKYRIGTGLSGPIYIIAHAVVCGVYD